MGILSVMMDEDASVACRMLGYGQGVPECCSTYGLASLFDTFQFTEISCKGDEMNLLDCPLKASLGCSRGKVAGVTCYGLGLTPEDIIPTTIKSTAAVATTTRPSKCKAGWHCKSKEECPAFLAEQSSLEALKPLTPKWLELVSKLKRLKCDGEESGVCCECEQGWQCKPKEKCLAYKKQEKNLKKLKSFSPEWYELVSKLEDLKGR